jgi:hypothetical protein
VEHQVTTYSQIVQAPRWAGLSSFIRDLAFLYQVKLNIEVEKGWIAEKIRFVADGEPDAIDRFRGSLDDAMNKYNAA